MKIAYLLMAHKETTLLMKVLSYLDEPEVDVFIHIDIKSLNVIELLTSSGVKNIHVIRQRVDINWGGFSILKAQLLLLTEAFRNQAYDYFIFVSGQDFPIKSAGYIRDFFTANAGKEYLEYFPLPAYDHWGGNGGLDRYSCFWPIDEFGFDACIRFYEKQLYEGVSRAMPNNLKPYGGSNWMSLTKDCVTYLLDFIKSNPKFLIFFSLVAHPEEIFFQTIILNSSFKENVVNNNLRYIDWNSNNASPRILDCSDYPNIIKSQAHFARKFELQLSKELLYQIERKLSK